MEFYIEKKIILILKLLWMLIGPIIWSLKNQLMVTFSKLEIHQWLP
jgi:hypothetical protein